VKKRGKVCGSPGLFGTHGLERMVGEVRLLPWLKMVLGEDILGSIVRAWLNQGCESSSCWNCVSRFISSRRLSHVTASYQGKTPLMACTMVQTQQSRCITIVLGNSFAFREGALSCPFGKLVEQSTELDSADHSTSRTIMPPGGYENS
jgi:hypothetical protein